MKQVLESAGPLDDVQSAAFFRVRLALQAANALDYKRYQ
jgi:hypothetical protein